MTDTLLQKLEEKMIQLLTELEMLRNETQQLKQENISLRTERVNHLHKLQELVSLLDTLDSIVIPEQSMKMEMGVADFS